MTAAKAVAKATETLVHSASGPQNELAQAASHALETLSSETDVVKRGIAALSPENMEGQVGSGREGRHYFQCNKMG